jgi:hypothetical protein
MEYPTETDTFYAIESSYDRKKNERLRSSSLPFFRLIFYFEAPEPLLIKLNIEGFTPTLSGEFNFGLNQISLTPTTA